MGIKFNGNDEDGGDDDAEQHLQKKKNAKIEYL